MKKLIATLVGIIFFQNMILCQAFGKDLKIFFYDKKTKKPIMFLRSELNSRDTLYSDKKGMVLLRNRRGEVSMLEIGNGEGCQKKYLPLQIKMNIDTCKKTSYNFYLEAMSAEFDHLLILFQPKTLNCYSINNVANVGAERFRYVENKLKITEDFADIFILLRCDNNLDILIEGGCSDIETRDSSGALIDKRMNLVSEYLKHFGVNPSRIFVKNNLNNNKKLPENMESLSQGDLDKIRTQNTYIYVKLVQHR